MGKMTSDTSKASPTPRIAKEVAKVATLDDVAKAKYLLAHHWRHKLVGNPWQWEKPPLPARYRLEDAYDLERSRERE